MPFKLNQEITLFYFLTRLDILCFMQHVKHLVTLKRLFLRSGEEHVTLATPIVPS